MATARNEHLSLCFKLAVVSKWHRCLRLMPHGEQATVFWAVVPWPLPDLCIRAAHLGVAQTCGDCLGLSVSTTEKRSMSLRHGFPSSEILTLLYPGILRSIAGLGKLHLTPGEFRHINIFKFYIFTHLWAITSPAFKGSNERRTQKRSEFTFRLHSHYSSYTGQMLKRSHSMSQPCPGLFHSHLWYSDIKIALQCVLEFAFSPSFQENKGINLAEKTFISILKMLQLLLLHYLHVGLLATVQLPTVTKAALCSSVQQSILPWLFYTGSALFTLPSKDLFFSTRLSCKQTKTLLPKICFLMFLLIRMTVHTISHCLI